MTGAHAPQTEGQAAARGAGTPRSVSPGPAPGLLPARRRNSSGRRRTWPLERFAVPRRAGVGVGVGCCVGLGDGRDGARERALPVSPSAWLTEGPLPNQTGRGRSFPRPRSLSPGVIARARSLTRRFPRLSAPVFHFALTTASLRRRAARGLGGTARGDEALPDAGPCVTLARDPELSQPHATRAKGGRVTEGRPFPV